MPKDKCKWGKTVGRSLDELLDELHSEKKYIGKPKLFCSKGNNP